MEYYRPIDPSTAERMSPKVLHDSASAVGSTPRCLCPLKEVDTQFRIGPQASVVKASSGLHSGEYIIKCRSEKCGYLSKFLSPPRMIPKAYPNIFLQFHLIASTNKEVMNDLSPLEMVSCTVG